MLPIRAFTLLTLAVIGSQFSPKPNKEPTSSVRPTCLDDHILKLRGEGMLATLAWQDSEALGERRITVIFDDAGNHLQYNELETSVPWETFDRQGTYRMVFLNFQAGFGVVELQNPENGRSQEQKDIREILASPDFGHPLETIRQVKVKCTIFQ